MTNRYLSFVAIASIVLVLAVLLVWAGQHNDNLDSTLISVEDNVTTGSTAETPVREPTVCDQAFPEPPENIRAVYMTSWVASTPRIRQRLVDQINDTDLNAVVIDIKDATGQVAIPVSDPDLARRVNQRMVKDLGYFVDSLCQQGIYPIARIVLFKDPVYAELFPAEAVQYESGNLWWGDGSYWVSAASEQFWDYAAGIAQDAYDLGFQEINLDYIRFPSIGDLSAAAYPYRGGRSKPEVIVDLLQYWDTNVRKTGPKVSVDLYGLSLSDPEDVGIGQHLEDFVPYVDVIAPMTYPSHYSSGFAGVTNPAEHPYLVMYVSVKDGIERLEKLDAVDKLRPWIQDFTIQGVHYGAAEVQQQIEALYDLGIESWTLWDPQNTYHYSEKRE
jgi:hypothetical protein